MFDILGLQVNRGTFNSQAIGGIAVSITHSYKNVTDTIAEITAPGYFPPNFGAKDGLIIAADLLTIIGSDNSVTAIVLNPLLATISIPSGSFPSGIIADDYNGTSPTSTMRFGPNQTVPVQVGNASSSVVMTGGVIADTYNGTSTLSNMQIGTNQTSLVQVGSAVAGVKIPGVLFVNDIDTIQPSDTLLIGEQTNNPVQIGKDSPPTPVLMKGGVTWFFGGGTISSYQRQVVTSPTMWTGAFSAPNAGSIEVQLINGTYVILSFKAVIAQGSASPGQFIQAANIIPAFARPTGLDATTTTTVITNDTPVFGTVYVVHSNGSVVMANGPSTVTDTFPATGGNNGFRSFSMGYSLLP